MNSTEVTPTSSAQLLAHEEGRLPLPEFVREDVIAIAQEMPISSYIPFSICYIVIDSDARAHVIDPGHATEGNEQRVLAALATRGLARADIASVVATHFHRDHAGLAADLIGGGKAPLLTTRREQVAEDARHELIADAIREMESAIEQWGVPVDRQAELRVRPALAGIHFRATAFVEDGSTLPIPGARTIVVHSPGHTPGHMVIADESRELLFTGDHILPTIHPGLGAGGPAESNALDDYLTSLPRLEKYADYEVLPGHGYRFTGLSARMDAHREHHLRRAREVAMVVREEPSANTWTIARQLTWSAGWDALTGHYLAAALRQTEIYRAYGLSHSLG